MALLHILSIDPPNDSTIFINQQFKIVFDKELDQTNLSDMVMLINSSSRIIPISVEYYTKTIDNNVVGVIKIIPNELLEMNTKHTLILRGDFDISDDIYNGIKSIDNDVFDKNQLFNFTTNTLTYNPPVEPGGEEPPSPPPIEQISFLTDIKFKPDKYPESVFSTVEPYIYIIVKDPIINMTPAFFHVSLSNLLTNETPKQEEEKDITITYQDNYVTIALNRFIGENANQFKNYKVSIFMDEQAISTDEGVTPAISYYYYSPIDVFFITPDAVRNKLLSRGYTPSKDEIYSIVYKESINIYTNPAFKRATYQTSFFYLTEKYILLRIDKEQLSGTIMYSNGIKSQTLLGANIVFNSPGDNATQLALINNELYALESEMRALLNKYGVSAVKSQYDIGYPIEWRSDV